MWCIRSFTLRPFAKRQRNIVNREKMDAKPQMCGGASAVVSAALQRCSVKMIKVQVAT